MPGKVMYNSKWKSSDNQKFILEFRVFIQNSFAFGTQWQNMFYVLTRVWVLHTPNTGQNMLLPNFLHKNVNKKGKMKQTHVFWAYPKCWLRVLLRKYDTLSIYLPSARGGWWICCIFYEGREQFSYRVSWRG